MSDEIGYTEAEKREIQLEAIVQALYLGYQQAMEEIPLFTPRLIFTNQLFDHLFNLAEIRDNIDDLCRVKLEFEGDE